MLKKLPLALMIFLGTCAAQQAQPLAQLQGTSRILMIFAPDTNSANFKRQLALIDHHTYELSIRNTVVVPVSGNPDVAAEFFTGEFIPLSSNAELSYARTRYHVAATEFTLLLLNEDGAEAVRTRQPMDIHQLVAQLDALPVR